MRNGLVVLWMLIFSIAPAAAQLSIGIDLPLYPDLRPIPGYPVYYAPRMNSNYFFYDGMYWVFLGDSWYASSWYNGPWQQVGPEDVPLYILRVPVRYYRQPPGYFRGWQSSAPPRWGEHWGNEWEQGRRGWDQWNRRSAPAPAPLPVYQRKYSGAQYPAAAQQQALQSRNYRYQPRDPVVRQHVQQAQSAPAPAAVQRAAPGSPQERNAEPKDTRRSTPPPVQQSAPTAPRGQPAQKAAESEQKSAPVAAPPQKKERPVQQQNPQPQQREAAVPHRQGEPKPQGQNEQKSTPAPAPQQRVAPPIQQPRPQPQQREAAPHPQQEPKPHTQEAAPQGRAAPSPEPAQEQGPAPDNKREKAGDRGQDHNK